MYYNVTDIKFDFNDDLDPIYSIPEDDQELIIREHLGGWEADDDEDLIEENYMQCGLVYPISGLRDPVEIVAHYHFTCSGVLL